MRGNKLLFIVVGFFVFIFMFGFVSAIPQITIHSPQNISYDSTKILVNVTSNEVVDFFFKDERTGKRILLENNTINLNSFIYAKKGGYEYIIWANNSNGTVNKSISFSTTAHNPINITDCGYLYSSDTKYILANNISTTGKRCLSLWRLRNISLNLNGYIITVNSGSGISTQEASSLEIFNGTIIKKSRDGGGLGYGLLVLEGSKFYLHDLNLKGSVGISIQSLDEGLFENLTINSTVGIYIASVFDTYIINSTIMWNGYNTGFPESYSDYYPTTSAAFFDQSSRSELFLQEVNVSGFDHNFYLTGTYADIYFRNSNIDISNNYYPVSWISDARFFKQHLVIINVSDQFNLTGACSVQVLDNEVLPRYSGLDAKLKTLANPTAELYIPTGATGTGQKWITEKLTLARSSSPAVITEYDFSNYTLITKGWGEDNYSSIQLNLTGHNSTIYVDFKITTGLQELPKCTISQMFDLNNDGVINIQDAVIILREISGLSVSEQTTLKECEGINLNPF